MARPALAVCALAALAALPRPARADDGLLWLSAPGSQDRLHVGGFLQSDARYFLDDDAKVYTNQLTFRSLRIQLDGKLGDRVDARVLPDFAGGKVVVQDAYVDLRYIPTVSIRVGKQKVPFGYERLQTEGTTILAERGLPTQIAPNRDIGLALYGAPSRYVEWQLGVFDGVPDGQLDDADVSDEKEVAARVLAHPIPGSGGRGLALGGAATYGFTHGTAAAPDLPVYKSSGQTTFFGFPVGTTLKDTAVANGRRWRATAQGSYFAGPVGVLAEYVRSTERVSLDTAAAEVTATAWQVAAQWVITGDDATYRSVVPRHPFDPAKGTLGAIDVTVRVDGLAVESPVFDSGIADLAKSARWAHGYTAGVDWFWSREIRLALDLERTTFQLGAKNGSRPNEDLILGRVQLAF